MYFFKTSRRETRVNPIRRYLLISSGIYFRPDYVFRKWLNELSYEIHKVRSRRRSESFYRAGLVIRAIFEKRFIARLLTTLSSPKVSPRETE